MLEAVAFLCGIAVMALEMTGSRLLAPFLGSSVLVWTALIGVILAFLSAGYWLGGKMADKAPTSRKLAAIILFAAFCVLLAAIFHAPLLGYVAGLGFRVEMAAVLATSSLFGPASFLLGMVSPYTVRVALQEREISVNRAGAVIGRFAALSSVGSIVGTFLGGFVFISWIGSRQTIYMLASVLMAVSLMALLSGKFSGKRPVLMLAAPLVGLGISLLFWHDQGKMEKFEAEHGFVRVDTRYSPVAVSTRQEGGSQTRYLYTPPNLLQSAMRVDAPNELILNYTKSFALAWQLRPEAKRFLLIGGAGYSVPKYLLSTRPNIRMDVAEIDPQMTELAKTYFNLKDDPRLHIYHEDGRVYLNQFAARQDSGTSKEPGYDIIMGDAFSSVYNIPFQLSTVECAQKIHDSLAPDGIFISNVISALSGEKSQLLSAIRASLEEVFPQVHVFPLSYAGNTGTAQNVLLLALKKPGALPTAAQLQARGLNPSIALDHAKEARQELETAAHLLDNEWRIRLAQELPPLRDDLAPVELYAQPLLN